MAVHSSYAPAGLGLDVDALADLGLVVDQAGLMACLVVVIWSGRTRNPLVH